MTSRERLTQALHHREPDRVPIDIGATHNSTIHIDAHERLKRHLGLNGPPPPFVDRIQQAVQLDGRIRDKLGIDTLGVWMNPPDNWKLTIHEEDDKYTFVDEWGVTWQKPKPHGYYFDLLHSPLAEASAEDLDSFPWPNPDDPGRTRGLAERVRNLAHDTEYALEADLTAGCVIELVWFQIGLVRYLTDLLLDPDFIRRAIERSLAVQKRMIHSFLTAVGDKVQVVAVNGDLGGQNAPLISPDLYRTFLKPYEGEVLEFVRAHTPVTIFRHTCGSIRTLIPDLIDIGVQVLNPIQVSAHDMDTGQLKEEFGDRLCFWGGIDNHVLGRGTPAQVRAEVKRRIRDLAPGGGYVLGAVHNIQRDVTPENVCAMIDAAREFGQYPIRL